MPFSGSRRSHKKLTPGGEGRRHECDYEASPNQCGTIDRIHEKLLARAMEWARERLKPKDESQDN